MRERKRENRKKKETFPAKSRWRRTGLWGWLPIMFVDREAVQSSLFSGCQRHRSDGSDVSAALGRSRGVPSGWVWI